MTTETTTRTCPRCGRTLPLTTEHFYFLKTGPRAGKTTGYCKSGGCQRAAWTASWAAAPAYQKDRHRAVARDYYRRQHGTHPDRYRVHDPSVAS